MILCLAREEKYFGYFGAHKSRRALSHPRGISRAGWVGPAIASCSFLVICNIRLVAAFSTPRVRSDIWASVRGPTAHRPNHLAWGPPCLLAPRRPQRSFSSSSPALVHTLSLVFVYILGHWFQFLVQIKILIL